MSQDGRSRSPKQSAADSDLETKMSAMWTKTIEPLMQEKNNACETAVKGLVVGLVSGEVNQLEAKMETGFVEVHEKFKSVNSTLERIEKAIATNPAPPLSQPGGLLGPGIAGSAVQHPLAAPSYASVVSSSPYQQPAENDVTTPPFTRKTNPTKLFANLHCKEKNQNPVLRNRVPFWPWRQTSPRQTLYLWRCFG